MATGRKRDVTVDIVVDDKKARANLRGVGDEAGKTGHAFDGLKGAVGGLVAALGARELADFALDAAKMAEEAANAGESASKVLGPALDSLHTRLDGIRGMLGFNVAELDQMVAQYGLLTESLGDDQAQAEFIAWLIETGGELAAFRGNLAEAPEAIAAMGGALRGEFDMLENFGIKLSQAAVNERALELSADPATAALSEQELQIYAIQSLINEKAAPAIGSLADAEDDLAAKTNEANVKWEDTKIALGDKLLPILISMTGGLLDLLHWLELVTDESQDLGDQAENLWRFFTQLAGVFGGFGFAIKPVVDGISALIGLLDKANQGMDKLFGDGRIQGGGARTGGNFGHVPGTKFHSGGVVGGTPGSDVPIIAQAGETIIPRGGGMGGEIVVPVTVNLDGRVLFETVQKYAVRARQSTGRDPFAR